MQRRKASEFASLSQIGAGRRFEPELRAPFGALAVFHAWTRAAGPQLGRVTRPAGWDGRRLSIEVRDPLWLRHLERLLPELLPQLNRALAGEGRGGLAIDEIILSPGRSGSEEPPR